MEEWTYLLNKEKAAPYIDVLLCFLREPEHKGTCSVMGLKYGTTSQYYNSKITNFAKWVQKELGRFRVVDVDGKPAVHELMELTLVRLLVDENFVVHGLLFKIKYLVLRKRQWR
ncbi:hypothetical protein [Bacteroides sp. Marseille-P3684]|uniref:hypothetical protein n=1 Tax=Bacteroides sp. Marseille-P3684 TaxID=2086579 RepID=UPI00130074DF|nr:hypothetical protein [Bacteroides sp. Marseille-P3684]